ncbi:opine metallophore biosynthesis dehydrogenase [Metasolibacillus meyeri]|uniref:opine metallophore biosynthesis dehydrogenase n=1 Tax=Metasolibacillus meyeri TaxID=1071052 RepID=UPI000D2F88C2|nr:opine metallophore biosynthesis dehydrogenase [Metasolibacillus meyeri]
MTYFKKVLLLGTGPTVVQLAVNFKNYCSDAVAIAGRESLRSKIFFESIVQHEFALKVSIQNKQHQSVAGECTINTFFEGYHKISGNWDTIVLSVTTDSYLSVLAQIDTQVLQRASCFILISPTFGSSHLVANFLKNRSPHAEIISFSTYYGDTRWLKEMPSNQVLTTGVKRTVFIGSIYSKSKRLAKLSELFRHLGIHLKKVTSPLEAETRNISLYVHPPLFMNDFSLNAIFNEEKRAKYVYKLYPEGPITYTMIRHLLNYWKEMMAIVKHCDIQPLNLLKFMVDDNYPLQPASIARQEIENFTKLEPIHQEYLLYIRYASLLIDPFSMPNQEGKYFDFSAVPIRNIFKNHDGEWDIPRMPKEDYYRVKIIQGIANALNLKSPMLDHFVQTYEEKLQQVVASSENKIYSEAFQVKSFSQDIEMICKELLVKKKQNNHTHNIRS